MAAAVRTKRLTQRLHREALGGFDRAYEEIATVGVDVQLALEAGTLASEYSLHGYDAIHLATALSLGEHDVALVSWDHDLSQAGLEAGLVVLGG